MRRVLLVALSLVALDARRVVAEQVPPPPPPIVISAAKDTVWAALTTVEGIVATDGGQATVDLRPSGAIRRHADARAAADAPGWTSTRVLAIVAPRLLVLGGDGPTSSTAIELDALDDERTRLRIEHTGVVAGTDEATATDEHDRRLVTRLLARFPPKPDPVVAAAQLLVGSWDERADVDQPVVARWTVVVHSEEREPRREPAVTFERVTLDGSETERWAFWRDPRSGRWAGGVVNGTPPAAWEIRAFRNQGLAWSDEWHELGGRTIVIEAPPRDDAVTVMTVEGCLGTQARWTRSAARR
jgi:hypothetical protein